MNLKNNERWTHKKNIFSFISEINITKFEWLRVKSTLNDAAKRVPFHYNQGKSFSSKGCFCMTTKCTQSCFAVLWETCSIPV